MANLIAYLLLFKYLIYLILWHLFDCCKHVWRILNGRTKIPSKNARLHKILFRYKRMPGENTRREDFVTFDNGFISMEVLKGPEWTIYSMDKKSVLFIQMPKPLIHYSIDKYPFIYPTLFEEGIQLAEIDLKTFIKFGDEFEIDYKPPKCLYFTNTARSASTLFGSMLHQNGHSIVIGEHPAITTLSCGFEQCYWNKNDIIRLLSPTIKILRKSIPSSHLLIFKVRSCDICLVPFLAESFPEIKHIFMFRKTGLSSVERMISTEPIILFLHQLYVNFPYFCRFLTSLISDISKDFKPKTMTEAAMLVYGRPYWIYKKNENLFDFPIVWQDELISSPEKVLKPIFEKLNLPSDTCVKHALACMEHDSQDGTFLSQKNMKQYSASEITPEIKETILSYAKRFEMELEILGFE